MKKAIKVLIITQVFIVLAVSSLSASEEVAFFRKIRIDESERIRGVYPLTEERAQKVNSYKISKTLDGRISRIEYMRSGTSLADPLLGVPVIQYQYNGSYIRRVYLDSRGKEIPDEQGIYSVRMRQNSSGAVTASFHYDRYGNLKADRGRCRFGHVGCGQEQP